MVCIYCGAKTGITNSRLNKKLNRVWRRRQCTTCDNIFTTIETIDEERSFVVRDDSGKLTPFLRDKLFISMYLSCGHRKTALRDAAALSDTAIGELFSIVRGENGIIEKVTIRQTVSEVLQRFDPIAATQYLAYYG